MSSAPLLTHGYFESLIEKSFTVQNGKQAVALRVIEVRLLPSPGKQTLTGKVVDHPSTRPPFSVYFRSEGSTGLGQGMYAMTPPDSGAPVDIFVVPLGVQEGGVIYEAVFN